MKTKEAFDAKLQKVVLHEVTIDGNNELLFQSTESDSFFKLPAVENKEELDALLAKHQDDNDGQVTIESQEKKLDGLFGEVETGETLGDPEE